MKAFPFASKASLSLSLCALFALPLAGCSGDAAPAGTPAATTAAGEFALPIDGITVPEEAPVAQEEVDDDFETRVREIENDPTAKTDDAAVAAEPAPAPKLAPTPIAKSVVPPVRVPYKKNVEIFVYSANAKLKPGAVKQEHIDVFYKGERLYTWLASTACHCVIETPAGTRYRPSTPRGTFPIQRAVRRETSKIFNDARMDFALYLGHKPNSGTAIHATYGAKLKHLGSPASAGCVRLAERNAETLFGLVMKEGRANAQITVRDLQTKPVMYPLSK